MTGTFFTILSFFYIFLLNIVYFSKKRLDIPENKIYSYLICSNLFGVILAIFCYFTIKNILIFPIINEIVSKLYILYLILWITLFSEYTIVISMNSLSKNYKKNRYIVYKIFTIVSIVSGFFSIFLKLEYSSEPGHIYSYGPSANVAYIIGLIYALICVVVMIKNIKKVIKSKYVPLLLYIFFGSIVTLIQKKHPELLLMTATESFVTFLMYFTIENPDLKLINELNIAKEQADRANNAKTDFLSSMSHEIRTPLNAIVGFSNSLNDNEELPESVKNDVKDILIASDTLLEIVNGVLDISKIEANKIEIIDKEYDTKKLFDELSKLTKIRIGDKPIKLITKFDQSTPRILYGDQVRLKQIILNFLTNAAKYTDEGEIVFRVDSVIKDDVVRLIISVKDTGRGIKQESIDKLFDKFERLEEDKNTTIEGTGLGLAITKKLVELMNGSITVNSTYGKGSNFIVTIDQKIVKNPTISLDDTDVHSKIEDYSNKKVLVVDDNKLNIKVATRLLDSYKLNIDSAESGFEAIDKLKENKYDLILMDDMMPKMNGSETFNKIKEEKLFDGPIVMLTANALTGMREKYLEQGFSDYLSKPIEKSELNRVLSKYLK